MRFTIYFALILSLVFFSGCGGGVNPLGTVHIEGTITLDGSPIEGANITLFPRDGEHAAGGLTDANGRFIVQTAGAPFGSGAKPGEYDVVIRKIHVASAGLSDEEIIQRFGSGMPPVTHLIPERYGDVRASGIDPITVTTDRRQNIFRFELSSE